jgi:hypothetical protein
MTISSTSSTRTSSNSSSRRGSALQMSTGTTWMLCGAGVGVEMYAVWPTHGTNHHCHYHQLQQQQVIIGLRERF